MNPSAQVFRDLLSTWQLDSSSQRVDALASELTAHIAQYGSQCVGLMAVSSIPRLFGLIYFLDGYGLLLRQRYRQQRDGVFIFVDRKNETSSEFAGSVVLEHRLEPAYEEPVYARAA